MKTILLTIFILCFTQYQFAQWVQVGNDINGEEFTATQAGKSYVAGSEFGIDVSINNNGSIVAGSSMMFKRTGKVVVYQNNSGAWSQLGNEIFGIQDYEFSKDDIRFGASIELNNNGDVLVVGAPFSDAEEVKSNYSLGNRLNYAGFVSVFAFNNSVWSRVGHNIYGDVGQGYIGSEVSINGLGDVVAFSNVGVRLGQQTSGDGWGKSEVHIYQNLASSWQEIGLINSDEDNAGYGKSICLNDAGDVIAIGIKDSDFGASESGRIQVFKKTGNSWVQLGGDIEGGVAQNHLGDLVSLNAAGDVLVTNVTNRLLNGGIDVLRVFKLTNNNWVQLGQDIIGDAPYDFGVYFQSVKISDDGTVVSGSTIRRNGLVQVFKYSNNSWSQISTSITRKGTEIEAFGIAHDLNSDGSVLVSSAIANHEAAYNAGQVRVFENNNTLSITEKTFKEFNLYESNGKIESSLENTLLKIYTPLGTAVLNQNLSKGIYIIKARHKDGKEKTVKFLIK